MATWKVWVLSILGILVSLIVVLGIIVVVSANRDTEPFEPIYAENCAVCHGEDMQGGALGPSLLAASLAHGDTVDDLTHSIAEGFPDRGMPGWQATMDEGHIRSLAIYIAERRVDLDFNNFKMADDLTIPVEVINTELASFKLEPVITGLDRYPFSIAPLPDGRMLLTERTQGLFVIDADGKKTQVADAPRASEFGVAMKGLNFGVGWLLDVAPHPDFASNGWIYLHHTHICETCADDGGETLLPVTMNRVVRGRIVDNVWVDEEVLWSAPKALYSSVPDTGAGGRLTFDAQRRVYFSIGIKGGYFEGVQDLTLPFGKIHRINDDGSIPADNPYAGRDDALHSIWTYGHRSPQGLEVDFTTGRVWGTEMGPRGGDEVNWLRPGLNYGWPLYSLGVDYDGTPVEYWKDLGIEFDLEDIEQPVVDFTPSPAISSFIIYGGNQFAAWQNHFLVGSLKATELYRLVIEGDELVEKELLIGNLARIRDIEADAHGLIYLLLEHEAGSQIVRLVPANESAEENALTAAR
ncbi:MAG: PQQ-dependent sugar dehydrogenase [Pseudomonadota bacterium]